MILSGVAIPKPQRRQEKVSAASKYGLDTLSVGGCLLETGGYTFRSYLRHTAYSYGVKAGKKFLTRVVGEEIWIWRLK